jgi:universal stress protein A
LSRILFCTDFSENSERTLKYAISLTSEYDAELTLLHVLEKVPRPARAADTIAAATEQLEKLIPTEERKTIRIATAVRIGKAYEQINQFAQESQSDLAILGVRGRDALDLAIFGSTTHRVMQLGPCPVLASHV